MRDCGAQGTRPRISGVDLQEAMLVELAANGISYESEKTVTVRYRDVLIQGQRVDLIVRGLIVVELKAVARFDVSTVRR